MNSKINKKLNNDINKSTPKDIRAIKAKGKFFIPFALMIPAIIFFSLFTIIPLIKVIFDSFQNENVNYASTYGIIWTDGDWYLSIFNSLVFSLLSVPITLILALIISFTLSNMIRKRFREFWQTIFFIPYVTSTVAISIVFSQLFSSQPYGIVNWILGLNLPWLETPYDDSPIAFVPVLIFGIWHSLAFKILILTSAMLSVDKRLYDAAAIDGANKKDMFFNITLPALNSTIWYLITIGLIGSLKVFPLALFDNSASTSMDKFPTMLTYVYEAVKTAQYGKAGAASISLIAVVIIFNYLIKKMMYFGQNYFINRKENKVKKEVQIYEEHNNLSSKYDSGDFEKVLLKIEEDINNKDKGDN